MRLRARHRKNGLTSDVLCGCVIAGIALGVILHGLTTDYDGSELIHHAEAATTTPIAKEVRIAVEIDWTRERIIKEIRDTFPETPDLAVRIATCESGLVADIQSGHVLSYGRERSYGIFQIHSPVWHDLAVKLGYGDYRTDPADNIAMARYIYDQSGHVWTAWSCYTKRMI